MGKSSQHGLEQDKNLGNSSQMPISNSWVVDYLMTLKIDVDVQGVTLVL
jgi:hypothetical protein